MRVITLEALPEAVGLDLGVSDWTRIDQARIDAFADLTGDHQWIHVDVERAQRERGRTIAHGLLTLSLLPIMIQQIWRLEGSSQGLNYGFNRIRFLNPVPAGARVRALLKLENAEPKSGGVLMTFAVTVQIEGQEKPALSAEFLGLALP